MENCYSPGEDVYYFLGSEWLTLYFEYYPQIPQPKESFLHLLCCISSRKLHISFCRLTKPAQNTLSAVSPGLYITALNPLLHWGQFTIEFPVTAHNVNFQFYRPQVSLNTNTFKPHTIMKISYIVLKNKNGWFYMFQHYILFTAYFYPFEVITLNAHWI